LDYYVLSTTESIQIGYDTTGKAKIISVDYQNGTGAPAPRSVIGTELELKDNGSYYKAGRYEKEGIWVAYRLFDRVSFVLFLAGYTVINLVLPWAATL